MNATNAVERIKELCVKKGMPLYKLEKECGFSNGYIGQLRKGTMPYERLQTVADVLGVSATYLSSGEDKEMGYYFDKETAETAQAIFENEELRLLFDAAKDASPEDLKTVHTMLLALKSKERE